MNKTGFFIAVASLTLVATPAMAGDQPHRWVVPEPAPDTPGYVVDFVDQSGVMKNTPREWRPQGRLIADSGFRPWVDGLGMSNWGNADDSPNGIPIQVNHYYLGYPLRTPANMSRSDVPKVIGRDEACIQGLPGCELRLSAELWREGNNAGMADGHCFGIATTVAQIFNGMLPKSSIGATSSVYQAEWSPTLMRQVARAFSTQTIVDLDEYTQSPRDVVQLLKDNLRSGYTPYTAAIRATNGEGHGVTPFALYDRGSGLYDVAVYDNNYPGRTRAFHIDTVKNTCEYLMLTRPGQPPLMAEGNIQLVPVEDLLPKNLPCAFCEGGDEVTVTIPPIKTSGKITATVTAPDGRAIRGMKIIPPTNPSSLIGYRSFPTFVVPADTRFRLTITSADDTVHTTSVTVHTGSAVFTPGLDIRPDSQTSFTYSPKAEKLTIQASKGTEGILMVADIIGETEWKFAGASESPNGLVLGPKTKLSATVDVERMRITLSRFRGGADQAAFIAETAGSAGKIAGLSQTVSWGSGGSVVCAYRGFTGTSVDGLKATLRDRDGTKTTLSFTEPPQ